MADTAIEALKETANISPAWYLISSPGLYQTGQTLCLQEGSQEYRFSHAIHSASLPLPLNVPYTPRVWIFWASRRKRIGAEMNAIERGTCRLDNWRRCWVAQGEKTYAEEGASPKSRRSQHADVQLTPFHAGKIRTERDSASRCTPYPPKKPSRIFWSIASTEVSRMGVTLTPCCAATRTLPYSSPESWPKAG